MQSKALPIMLLALGVVATAGHASAQDGAPSYTIEDVTACSADAMRLCRDKLPNIEDIEGCMKAHYAQLRPKCQIRFKGR